MPLPNYTPEKRRQVAEKLECDEQYIYQCLRRLKTPSPSLARQWSEFDPEARLEDLRPDDWHLIWPELVTEGKPLVDPLPEQVADVAVGAGAEHG